MQRGHGHGRPLPGRAPADADLGPPGARVGRRRLLLRRRRSVEEGSSSGCQEAPQAPVRSVRGGGREVPPASPSESFCRGRGRGLARRAQQLLVVAGVVAGPPLPLERRAAGLHRRGAAAASGLEEAAGDPVGAREAAGAAVDRVEPGAELVVALGEAEPGDVLLHHQEQERREAEEQDLVHHRVERGEEAELVPGEEKVAKLVRYLFFCWFVWFC